MKRFNNRGRMALVSCWVVLVLVNAAGGQSNPNSRRLSEADISWLPATLKTTISVSFRDVPLEEALHMIAVKGDLRLSYNRDQLPAGQDVTLELTQVPALEVLLQVAELTRTEVLLTNGEHLAIVPALSRPGEVGGLILDLDTGQPLRGVNVALAGTYMGAASDPAGRFIIRQVPPGQYSVQFSMMGYAPELVEVEYDGYNPLELAVQLEPRVLSLDKIIITPGHFSLMEEMPTTRLALSAEDIRSFPQLGEDIYRAVTRLPGVSSNDIAAGFYMRGGEHREILVQLDGMELYNPFHLKLLDGFMSIIDVESIRGVDMITGAFPAEYGNRLSGVFSMKTVSPQPQRNRTSVGISFLNARVLAERSFAKGRGQWMLLARRGYMDIVFKNASEDLPVPFYYDILAKLRYSINERHSLSAHVLWAQDDWDTTIDNDQLNSHHRDGYGWLTWYSQWSSSLRARTLFSRGRVVQYLSGNEVGEEGQPVGVEAQDDRYMHVYGLKQDWSWDVSKNYLLKWGLDAKLFHAYYDYYHRVRARLGFIDGDWVEGYDFGTAFGVNEGTQLGMYVSQRMRPWEPLAIELGIRYDQTSWSGDNQASPRINLAYTVSEKTSIRTGWGYYFQSQGIDQNYAQDDDPTFYPAERAEHRVLGIEHELPGGAKIRVEGYQKLLTSLRPHYVNLSTMAVNIIPSLGFDRYRLEPDRGDVMGLEFYLRREGSGPFSYWLTYSISRARERVDGDWILRYYDQTHTLYGDVSWKPNHKWRLNLGFQYHTGWPYSVWEFGEIYWRGTGWDWEWIPGPLYEERFPDYKRLDIRINRHFYTKRGRLTAFLEVRNLLDTYNPRSYTFEGYWQSTGEGDEGEWRIRKKDSIGWMGGMPSFGILWEL